MSPGRRPRSCRLQGFVYALDFGNSAVNSSLTKGLKASGKTWVGLYQLAYNATYATQSDYHGNTPKFDLDYFGGDIAGTFDIYTVKAGYESLEGNGTRGFTTPLATVHAFQGWSDAFVSPGGAKLGFIALTDAAPLIVAKEKGFFEKYGMPDVDVAKQASWGATRDNLVLGGAATASTAPIS
jgi:hypothetical protein